MSGAARRLERPALWAAALLALALGARPAAGAEAAGEEFASAPRLTLKAAGLAARQPADERLFPERETGQLLGRARLDWAGRRGDREAWELAYEQRASRAWGGAGAGAGAGLLPAAQPPPYRLAPGDWPLADDEERGWSWRHELDRANLMLHRGAWTATAGRQAVGLGRAVIFPALDFFAPFAPAEFDREWRRGVDALRLEVETGPAGAAEALAVGAESRRDAALLGRWRGYAGRLDAELLAGRRGEDWLGGAALSAAVGEAELHGEGLLAGLPAGEKAGAWGAGRLAGLLTVGGSYTLGLGRGLTVLGEYSYSGLGLTEPEELPRRLRQPEFARRLARGDLRFLGRHALGLQAALPLTGEWAAGLLLLQNPADLSGLASPSLSWSASDNFSLNAGLYLPWGAPPSGGLPQSEYGASALAGYLQLALCY